jgi:hypothetical protein
VSGWRGGVGSTAGAAAAARETPALPAYGARPVQIISGLSYSIYAQNLLYRNGTGNTLQIFCFYSVLRIRDPNFFHPGSAPLVFMYRNRYRFCASHISVKTNIYAESVFRNPTTIDLALLDPDPDSGARKVTNINN